MVIHFIKIRLRNLLRNKTYSLITIAGLAVGMAASIVILLYVRYELSYDRFFKHADRIYRVVLEEKSEGKQGFQTIIPEAVSNSFEKAIPEIENVAVAVHQQTEKKILANEHYFIESKLVEAGPSFFDMFGYQAIRGDLHTAFREPGTAVVTASTARKYFGDANPMGKTITYEKYVARNGRLGKVAFPYRITAVIKDPPENSHLPIHIVTRYMNVSGRNRDNAVPTYVLLRQRSDPAVVEEKIDQFIAEQSFGDKIAAAGQYGRQHSADASEGRYSLHLQPVTDIHLHPQYQHSGTISNALYFIYLLSAVALIILVIACLNYMNLTTAQTMRRLREVGVRKTLGAGRSQVIFQFIGESMLLSLIALLFALLFVELFLPTCNAMTGKQLTLDLVNHPVQLFISLGVTILTGFAGGIYPALVFSSYQAANVLRAGLPGQPAGRKTRNVMVVIQFAISIALILSTTVIFRQMNMIQNSRTHIGKDKIVLVESFHGKIFQYYNTFRNDLKNRPEIVDVTYGVMPEEYSSMATLTDSTGNQVWINDIKIAPNLLDVFGITPVAGESFLERSRGDLPTNAVIITKKTADLAGIKYPVGQELPRHSVSADLIIGVISDYHVQPFYKKSEPAMFHVLSPDHTNDQTTIMVRLHGGQIQKGLQAVKTVWKKYLPGQVPLLTFLDDKLDQAYRTDLQMGSIIGWFTFLAIVIATMGLFGLARFAAKRRTKEIGIRKVVGASVTQVVALLEREFLMLVAVANLLAWPVAYYTMNTWLQNFAYRIDLTVWPFLLARAAVLAIARLAVSWQTLRAATANPVDALRYE